MSVTIRPARGGKGWEYSIVFTWPEGGWFRERRKAPVHAKSAALRWAEARERALLAAGKAAYEAPATEPAPAPAKATLAEFWPRFVRDHYRANRKKPSTITSAEGIYRKHLAEPLGGKALDAITTADVAALKGRLADAAPKTVNNVLSVLSRCLNFAVEVEAIPGMRDVPCRIDLLNVVQGARDWYELHDYRRLVDGARKVGLEHLVLVLLAGSAGLRRGEIIALRWTDLDLGRRLLHVQRAVWSGHEEAPKGGRDRRVPMTEELHAALTALRATGAPLRSERVLTAGVPVTPAGVPRGRGRPAKNAGGGVDAGQLTNRIVRNWLASAQRRAGLEPTGAIHTLRHTFCSHLAVAGVPARAIQELAGHADLATTQRYMHLSPANRSEAVATLARFYATDADGARDAHTVRPIFSTG